LDLAQGRTLFDRSRLLLVIFHWQQYVSYVLQKAFVTLKQYWDRGRLAP
jgi:hypothetical protein